jgi:hypothetical protein
MTKFIIIVTHLQFSDDGGACMSVKDEHLAAINKLFRTQTVVVLTDLLRALRKRSAVTVFHVLKAMGYYTSYSHKGRYYTLERIPKFDDVNIPRQSRGLYGVSRSKRLLRSLLTPTSLLDLARTNDCAQHSHPSAAIRAIFIASMHLCHSPTFKNRKPRHTPGNVKLLLPPRQSRGISHLV